MHENPRTTRIIGRDGERIAAWFLIRRGYKIRERNLRLGRFEIDLVAVRGSWLVFVEVKTRSASAWQSAQSSLRADQARRLAAAADGYAARVANQTLFPRFDVIAIDEGPVSLIIEHYRDVLGPGGALR